MTEWNTLRARFPDDEFDEIERKVEEGSYQYNVMENHKFSIQQYKTWVDNLDYEKKF